MSLLVQYHINPFCNQMWHIGLAEAFITWKHESPINCWVILLINACVEPTEVRRKVLVWARSIILKWIAISNRDMQTPNITILLFLWIVCKVAWYNYLFTMHKYEKGILYTWYFKLFIRAARRSWIDWTFS